MSSSEDSDSAVQGLSAKEIVTPRRGLRKKKMSLKAVELAALKSREFTSDESNLDDYIDKCQAANDCKVLLEKQDLIERLIQKTPYNIRSRINKVITNVQNASSEEEEEEDEFATDEDSNYKATDSNDSSSTEKSDVSDSDTSEHEAATAIVKTSNLKTPTVAPRHKKDYLIKPDDFFSNHGSKKTITSNHTLDKLKMPRLAQTEVQKILSNMQLSNKHEMCLSNLNATHKKYFSKWWCLLHENYSVLLYGLGSKRNILQMFHTECLSNLTVVVVNGFFPKLSIKDIVEGIVVDVLHSKDVPGSMYECCELIEKAYKRSGLHLYIIVHNIDGETLQNNKSQNVLANLATINNVHLIASIDHVNSPLIWDFYKLSKFNFSWWDTTTFLPYLEETAFESSMMVQNTGSLALSALKNIFLSLTTNSKGIYNIIVKHQLANNSSQYYQGLLFKDLYMLCREAFLVSSDLALRAQLNEFVDHKMVKYKRSVDGNESLIIPISNALLRQFLDEQS